MFISRNEFYLKNLKDAHSLTCEPATLEGNNGNEPAVAIFHGRQIRYVLPIPEALRIATAIADAIQAGKDQS
ncbi:hypothetical protein GCM10023081_20030 [Arthrobacter ginkgonis]|uniref:Uncharacterized protein n=1 Tax=Arthrobacter ginkgonis TaxID=1630594 RepID=A0ABP7CAW8_9MICC